MKPFIPVAAALLVFLALGSVYQVEESQVAVRFQVGRVVESNIKPGLHFKIPFVQTVLKVRSEEHTSELQSLMRISYAVFCLKKKNIRIQYNTYYINHRKHNK